MKKILFLFVLSFTFLCEVYAEGFVTYTSYASKCSNLVEGKVVVPVRVVSINSGNLRSNITNYNLGDIDVNGALVSIDNISGDSILNVGLKDEVQGVSEIYFTLEDDIYLKNVSDILSFNLIYEFNDNIPSSINVLGNDVIVSQYEDICNTLNSFDITDLEEQAIVSENKLKNGSKIIICVLGGIIFILIVCFIIVIRRKK